MNWAEWDHAIMFMMLWCRCKRSRRVRVCSGDKGGGKWIEQVWAKWIKQAGREQVQQQRRW